MVNEILAAIVTLAIVIGGPDASAQPFVAPTPEVTPRATTRIAPRKPQQPRPPSRCEQMSRAWVDYRPVHDVPAEEGRASVAQLRATLPECESEQRKRPSDARTAFIFARALELNGQTSRAAALYRKLSDAGYAPASTQLARAFYLGDGIVRDTDASCRLYVGAANAGDIWAYNGAADCLSFMDYPHDSQRACAFFRKAQASNTFQTVNLSPDAYCK